MLSPPLSVHAKTVISTILVLPGKFCLLPHKNAARKSFSDFYQGVRIIAFSPLASDSKPDDIFSVLLPRLLRRQRNTWKFFFLLKFDCGFFFPT